MSKYAKSITFDEARKIAELAVLRDADSYEINEIKKALEDHFLEVEHCWIFFRNKEIKIRPESWFSQEYNAFAIGKSGKFSQISTIHLNDEGLSIYLKEMSDYFQREGGEIL